MASSLAAGLFIYSPFLTANSLCKQVAQAPSECSHLLTDGLRAASQTHYSQGGLQVSKSATCRESQALVVVGRGLAACLFYS